MERISRFSFGLLRVASLGIIVVYLIAVITVGSAGHSSGDLVSFFLVFGYSALLFILISRFQKRPRQVTRALLLVMLIPAVALFLYYIFMIVYEALMKESGLMNIKLFIAMILIAFIVPGVVVIKALMSWKFSPKAIHPNDSKHA